MAPSIEVQKKRRQLMCDGAYASDPFELLAQLLVRNEELQEQVELLQLIVNRQ